MFYYISGKLGLLKDGIAVIDACGVGYCCTISGTTYESLRREADQNAETVKLFTHMAVREDGVELFGFSTESELATFRLLIGVSGIGPKAATSILTTLSPEKLAIAVCSEDQKAISKANGIGAKTAARVILELKDKMMKDNLSPGSGTSFTAESPVSSFPGQDKNKMNEALDALLVLGYSKPEAISALKEIDCIHMDLESIIRTALKKMMR